MDLPENFKLCGELVTPYAAYVGGGANTGFGQAKSTDNGVAVWRATHPHAPVAQWLEHPTHNRQVVGSSPTRRTPVAYVSERGATLIGG